MLPKIWLTVGYEGMAASTHNQALQLTVKTAAPIVALLFTASELGR
jgi:hypothetical protein